MVAVRLIARLDIKGPKLIKGVQFEGLRVVGDPNEFARRYYSEGIDEILFMDAVAALYKRETLREIVRRTAREVFVPMTVGGGIRSVEDVKEVLRFGADKVAVNTAAMERPELISEVAERFGSQCMVLSIEAKKRPGGGWEALVDNGREHTGRDAVAWAQEGERRGAGEILLTSVDRDGTGKGFDVELVRLVSSVVGIPVIACGGMGRLQDLVEVIQAGRADALAMGTVLHYGRISLEEMRAAAREKGIDVRQL